VGTAVRISGWAVTFILKVTKSDSCQADLALELEKQLAIEAKKQMLATQNNNVGKAVVARLPQQEKGQA